MQTNASLSPREDRLGRIETMIGECEDRLDRHEHGRLSPNRALRRRLALARDELEELKQEAPVAEVTSITTHLATWAGNLDPLPDPRRSASCPFEDPRKMRR